MSVGGRGVAKRIGCARSLALTLTATATLAALGGCAGSSSAPAAIEDVVVRVTGHEFAWRIRYPGPDGRLDTTDDEIGQRDLFLPLGARATLELASDDYVYTVALPHLGLREIAVPDLAFSLRFRADRAGAFPLRTDELCGLLHPALEATVYVEPPERWRARIAALGRKG